jgi:hypothetical protein
MISKAYLFLFDFCSNRVVGKLRQSLFAELYVNERLLVKSKLDV